MPTDDEDEVLLQSYAKRVLSAAPAELRKMTKTINDRLTLLALDVPADVPESVNKYLAFTHLFQILVLQMTQREH